MDITYLLWLQDFRNSIDNALTPFVEGISFFSVSYIILLPVFVFWCLDKRKGLFILFAWRISQTINAAVKLTACIYRPWIKDPRIIPAGNALTTATGYSFPSGHTMMAVPIYGGLALYARKIKWLCWLLVLAILTLMFSRNYLGVHTPQDVLVGLVLGCLSIWIADYTFKIIDRNPESENKILTAELIFALAVFAYVNLKSYPMDYVDGKLLVDPNKMTIDSWGDVGGLVVLIIARFIEKKFINFSETGFYAKGVILCVIGLIPLGFMIYGLKPVIVSFAGAHLGRFLYETCLTLHIMLIWPAVLKLLCGK